MKLGVALPAATTLPGYPHDDVAIIAALDAWAERIGRSIGFSGPLYPALFPVWCDLSRDILDANAPIGPRPPSSALLGGLWGRAVQPVVYLLTSGWAAPDVPSRPNWSYLAGDHDAELRRWARAAARRVGPESLLVRLDWEMNGHWAPWSVPHTTPQEFTDMWRHIVTVMRGETDRLLFWWCPTARGWDKAMELIGWYPGPEFVDVLGFDGYAGDGEATMAKRWLPTFTLLNAGNNSHKPIIVGETGIARIRGNARTRADWWRGLRDIAADPAWSALEGVVAFDIDMTPWEGEGTDWRLNSGMDRVTARMLR